jgi:hypothetical protein
MVTYATTDRKKNTLICPDREAFTEALAERSFLQLINGVEQQEVP